MNPVSVHTPKFPATRNWPRALAPVLAGAAAFIAALPGAAAAPAAGDTYVYRVSNGYNKETRGRIQYRVDRVDAGSITVAVAPDHPDSGPARTEIYTTEGNGRRHVVDSHGTMVDYTFDYAYPAYAFPLDPGKSWSVRVNATANGDQRARRVRVDGKVLGTERVRLPAGEFDTVKIRRLVYSGDSNFNQTETQIVETEWYAPALGRAVRTERRSSWQEPSRCVAITGCTFYGNWDVIELSEALR